MKLLARRFCYWKNINRHIEELVKSCKACCQKQNQPANVEIHPWMELSGPWQSLHIDFADPHQGHKFFIVVDAFTKWVDIMPTKTSSS